MYNYFSFLLFFFPRASTDLQSYILLNNLLCVARLIQIMIEPICTGLNNNTYTSPQAKKENLNNNHAKSISTDCDIKSSKSSYHHNHIHHSNSNIDLPNKKIKLDNDDYSVKMFADNHQDNHDNHHHYSHNDNKKNNDDENNNMKIKSTFLQTVQRLHIMICDNTNIPIRINHHRNNDKPDNDDYDDYLELLDLILDRWIIYLDFSYHVLHNMTSISSFSFDHNNNNDNYINRSSSNLKYTITTVMDKYIYTNYLLSLLHMPSIDDLLLMPIYNKMIIQWCSQYSYYTKWNDSVILSTINVNNNNDVVDNNSIVDGVNNYGNMVSMNYDDESNNYDHHDKESNEKSYDYYSSIWIPDVIDDDDNDNDAITTSSQYLDHHHNQHQRNTASIKSNNNNNSSFYNSNINISRNDDIDLILGYMIDDDNGDNGDYGDNESEQPQTDIEQQQQSKDDDHDDYNSSTIQFTTPSNGDYIDDKSNGVEDKLNSQLKKYDSYSIRANRTRSLLLSDDNDDDDDDDNNNKTNIIHSSSSNNINRQTIDFDQLEKHPSVNKELLDEIQMIASNNNMNVHYTGKNQSIRSLSRSNLLFNNSYENVYNTHVKDEDDDEEDEEDEEVEQWEDSSLESSDHRKDDDNDDDDENNNTINSSSSTNINRQTIDFDQLEKHPSVNKELLDEIYMIASNNNMNVHYTGKNQSIRSLSRSNLLMNNLRLMICL